MPEVNFTINEQTGEMEMQIEGVQGTSCADVAKLVKELLGQPAREENTREFFARSNIKLPIQPQKRT
ncbi:MAG: DUF2997 domain-containing protein [Acidobacteria bacterium]|nr:DUF2997 domain-containing protein [Acidobacteriota bacterium]